MAMASNSEVVDVSCPRGVSYKSRGGRSKEPRIRRPAGGIAAGPAAGKTASDSRRCVDGNSATDLAARIAIAAAVCGLLASGNRRPRTSRPRPAAKTPRAGGCHAALAEVRRLGRLQAGRRARRRPGLAPSRHARNVRLHPQHEGARSRSSPPTRRRSWSTRDCSGSAPSRATRPSSCPSSSRRPAPRSTSRSSGATRTERCKRPGPRIGSATCKTGKAMTYPWVFAGSRFWTDEETGKQYYQAEGGDFICVSNFGTADARHPGRRARNRTTRWNSKRSPNGSRRSARRCG